MYFYPRERDVSEMLICDESTHRVTVQHVDGQIVRCEVHGLEHLIQRHHLPTHCTHSDLAVRLEAFLNEPQKMLLVHTGSSVNVSVNLHSVSSQSVSHNLLLEIGKNLSDVIEISVRDSFLFRQLSDLVEEDVKFIFGLEELQPLEAETLQRAVSNHPADQLHVRHEGV